MWYYIVGSRAVHTRRSTPYKYLTLVGSTQVMPLLPCMRAWHVGPQRSGVSRKAVSYFFIQLLDQDL